MLIQSIGMCLNLVQILSFKSKADVILLVVAIVILLLCIQPFKDVFYRVARYQLLVVLWQILISPFGMVRFRDFFFADIITSMAVVLGDIGFTFAYFK